MKERVDSRFKSFLEKIFFFIVVFGLAIGLSQVLAWTNPTQNPPGGNGVITVNSSGNVGIGTANPGAKLEVNGQVKANSAEINGQIKITGGSPGANKILTSDTNGLATWQTPTGGLSGSGSTNYIAKFTGASSLNNSIIYDNGTNVGIGTAGPSQKLDVVGYIKGQSGLCIGNDCRGSWPSFSGITGGGTTNRITKFTSGSNVGDSQISDSGSLVTIPTILQVSGNRIMGSDGLYPMSWVPGNGNTTVSIGGGSHWVHTFQTDYNLWVYGTMGANVKYFDIPHPLDPDNKRLVHSSLEGPEVGVFYRGTAQLINGEITINLPDYFEKLTRKENRNVLLTNIDGFDNLAVKTDNNEQINNGRFIVHSNNPTSNQKFNWEVKAVRADVTPLQAERPQTIKY